MQSQSTVPLANFGNQVAYQAQATVNFSVHPPGRKIPPPVAPKPFIIKRSQVRFKSQAREDENETRSAGEPIYDQVKIRKLISGTNGEVKQSPDNEYTSTGYAVPKLHLKQNPTKHIKEETATANRKENFEEEVATSRKDQPCDFRKKSIEEEELDELEYLKKVVSKIPFLNVSESEENNIDENNIEESNIEENNIKENNIEENNIKENNIEENNIKQVSPNRERSKSIEDELAELQSLTDLLELDTAMKNEPQNDYQKDEPKKQPEPERVKDVGDIAGELDELTNMLLKGLDGLDVVSKEKEDDTMGLCFNCKQKINSAGSGCTALGSTYHLDCFKCGKCDDVNLFGKEFYVVENVAHCDKCYRGTLEECATCSQKIADKVLHAIGCSFHPGCFKCCACEKMLDTLPFILDDDKQPHCVNCYQLKYAPKCAICDNIISSQNEKGETTSHIVSMEKNFHTECYKCEDCGMKLSSEIEGHGCYPLDGHIYCLNCNGKRLQVLRP